MASEKDKQYEEIESWLDGTLPEQEAAAFARRLEQEEELAYLVEQHRAARGVIEHWVAEGYKARVKQWRESFEAEELTKNAQPGPKKNWWPWLIGLVLLGGGLAWWLWPKATEESTKGHTVPQPNTPIADTKPPLSDSSQMIEVPPANPEKPPVAEGKPKPPPSNSKIANPAGLLALADEGLSIYIGRQLSSDRGGRGSSSQALADGFSALQSGDYDMAKSKLTTFKESDGQDFTKALELLAIVSYRQKDYAQAVSYFEHFTDRSPLPSNDLRLLHFYLTDYERQKSKFWAKLKELKENEEYAARALDLEAAVEKLGFLPMKKK